MSEENHNEPEKIPEVAEIEAEDTAAKEIMPVCPHCGADPVFPLYKQFQIGVVRACAWYCKDCRKLVPIFLLPSAPPRIVPPQPGGRIVRP